MSSYDPEARIKELEALSEMQLLVIESNEQRWSSASERNGTVRADAYRGRKVNARIDLR